MAAMRIICCRAQVAIRGIDSGAGGTIRYQVAVNEGEARPTAVVPATTTWQQFSTQWRKRSDAVLARLNADHRGMSDIMGGHAAWQAAGLPVEQDGPVPAAGAVMCEG